MHIEHNGYFIPQNRTCEWHNTHVWSPPITLQPNEPPWSLNKSTRNQAPRKLWETKPPLVIGAWHTPPLLACGFYHPTEPPSSLTSILPKYQRAQNQSRARQTSSTTPTAPNPSFSSPKFQTCYSHYSI